MARTLAAPPARLATRPIHESLRSTTAAIATTNTSKRTACASMRAADATYALRWSSSSLTILAVGVSGFGDSRVATRLTTRSTSASSPATGPTRSGFGIRSSRLREHARRVPVARKEVSAAEGLPAPESVSADRWATLHGSVTKSGPPTPREASDAGACSRNGRWDWACWLTGVATSPLRSLEVGRPAASRGEDSPRESSRGRCRG